MSPRLQVSCQTCGPVEIPADQVTVRHARGGDRVEWECPNGCGPAVWRPHPAFLGFLDARGIGVREVWEVPREMTDPVRRIESTTRTAERIDLMVSAYGVRLARRDYLAEVAREQQAALDEVRRRNEGK